MEVSADCAIAPPEAYSRMRRVAASVRSDERGIALQTAIIMATLIAIALAISAVIYTRGGEVADDLERQQVTFDPSRFRTQALCEEYDYRWDTADGCVDPDG